MYKESVAAPVPYVSSIAPKSTGLHENPMKKL